ncbi:MAG: SRPBCC domain-containing protein [Nannocystaceae bacterium]
MSHEIVTEFTIPAPPERVWRVLLDTAAYPEWNPLIPQLRYRGDLVAGRRALLTIAAAPRGPRLVVPIRVRCVDYLREFSWEGGPALLRGTHYHRIVASDGTSTRLRHGERFRGALASALWPRLEPRLAPAYRRFNDALIDRVAALAAD